MPAKSICTTCGQKYRSATHICHPNSIAKRARYNAVHDAVDPKRG